MSRRTNLDMDLLRSLVTGFELGSFARAAERLGRSQSAISTQLRRLERQVGHKLVVKSGRGLALTAEGESLFGYAKRLLDLNDEAVESVRGGDMEGWARLGLPQDFAEAWLPTVLRRFSHAHPKVRIEVQVDRSGALIEKTLNGELDLALVWGDGDSPNAVLVAETPIRWIALPNWSGAIGAQAPLPFAAFSPPCQFRWVATRALDDAGLAWRLAFTSPSLAGLWAAAESGLGFTARTAVNLPGTLAVLDPAQAGLPPLPAIPLKLHRADADQSPAVEQLREIVMNSVYDQIVTTR